MLFNICGKIDQQMVCYNFSFQLRHTSPTKGKVHVIDPCQGPLPPMCLIK